ncbi:ATP-binding protein [Thermodesulfobacteriota bacterium]
MNKNANRSHSTLNSVHQIDDLLRMEETFIAVDKATRAIRKQQDFHTTARSIFDICSKLIGAPAGYIALLSEDGTANEVLFLESGGLPCSVDPSLPMPIRGLRAEVYASGKTLYHNDFHTSEWAQYLPELHVELENVLFTPLLIDGRAIGTLGMANKPGGFTDTEARLASLFGELAAIALQNNRTNELLSTSVDRFQSVIATIPYGIQECDTSGTILFCNPALYNILNYSSDELTGKKIWDFLPTDSEKDEFHNRFERIVRERPLPQAIITKHRTKTGRIIDVLIDWDYTTDKQGSLTGLILIVTDITDRVLSEVALQNALWTAEEEKTKTETIIAAIGDGISIQDKDYMIIYQNQIHRDLLGDNIGKKCYEANAQGQSPCEDCPLADSFQAGEIQSSEIIVVIDGEPHFLEITASPLRDQTGVIIAGIEVVRDITDRRRMMEDINKAKNLESLGELAGGIAHDFNNLLTAVFGNIELARHYLSPDSPSFSLLSHAGKASEQAKELTRQLLTFSKGGFPIKKSVSIDELLRGACAFTLSGSEIQYDLSVNDDLWQVEIDRGQMSQVFHNLLTNAKEALAEGGTVQVKAENLALKRRKTGIPLKTGHYLKISITDNGAGIGKKYLPKIFDPYYSTKGKGSQKGTGLGLAICHSVILKHGGHISVASSPGQGTTVTLYLPASISLQEQSVIPMPLEESTTSPLILVMDDEESVIFVTQGMLNHLGYQADFVRNGDEALELYRKALISGAPYDLTILDLTIRGGMGATDAIQKLRSIDPDIKALVASGYPDDPAMSNPQEYGFLGAISKPFTLQTLSQVIHTHLSSGKPPENPPA